MKETVAHFGSVSGVIRQLEPERRVLSYTVNYKDGKESYEESLNLDLSHLLGGERPFPEPTVEYYLYQLREHLTSVLNRTNDILVELAATLRERVRNHR